VFERLERTPKWRHEFGAVLVGLFTGLAAIGFHHLIAVADSARLRLSEQVSGSDSWAALGVILVCGTLSAASVALVRKVATEAEGSGIAAVLAAHDHVGPVRAWRIVLVKFLGGFLGMSAGMPLGREGPSVQIGAMTGVILKNRFPLLLYRSRAIRLGAAGGLAAAFNAPLTAVVFTFEMLRQPFNRRNCVDTILVCAVADWVSRTTEGPRLELPLDLTGIPSLPLLFPVIMVGILTGIVAILFQKAVLFCHDRFEHHFDTDSKAIAATFVFGCVLGILFLTRPEMLGVGRRLFASALENRMTLGLALTALAIRVPLTAMCYATGAPGGLIVPAILFGTLTGQAFSCATTYFWHDVSVDYHTVCLTAGMAAGLGAIFRIPLTAIVLTAEVTGTFDRLLEICIAYVVAHMLLTRLRQPDLYAALALQRMQHENRESLGKQHVGNKTHQGE
jgi:CIC family chloride channel protein